MGGVNDVTGANFYKRRTRRGLEESQRASTVYPKKYVARNNAALYAMYAGDFSTATKQAETVLTMNPSYRKAFIAIALSQLGQTNITPATQTYNRLAAQGGAGQSIAIKGLADIALYEPPSGDSVTLLTDGIAPD